jgi:hypothetical protein
VSEELNQMLTAFIEEMSPRGAAAVFEDASRDAGLLSDPNPPRPSWRRNVLAFSGGALGIVMAVGAVILLWGTSPDEVVATDPPVDATSVPAVPTTVATESTVATTVADDPVVAPPQIIWERIDAPGAFDLESPLWTADGDLFSAQSIEAILAVPSCRGCDDIAMYLAGGHIGIQGSQWDARVWISEDGRTWTAVEAPGFTGEGSQTIRSFATDGTRIVAAGVSAARPYPSADDRASAWVSDDLGRSWTPVVSDALTGDGGRFTDVAWTGSGFIGAGSEFWFSPDGSTWEISTDLSPSERVSRVIAWESGWVAVGENPVGPDSGVAMWASDDGVAWEPVFAADPASNELTTAFDVLAGRGSLIATGYVQVWRSSDGVTWARVPWEPGTSVYERRMQDLALIDDWVIASGHGETRSGPEKAFMWASPDGGATWVSVSLDPDVFDPPNDQFGALEVLAFPADAASSRLVLAGSHRGNAAIWVGERVEE